MYNPAQPEYNWESIKGRGATTGRNAMNRLDFVTLSAASTLLRAQLRNPRAPPPWAYPVNPPDFKAPPDRWHVASCSRQHREHDAYAQCATSSTRRLASWRSSADARVGCERQKAKRLRLRICHRVDGPGRSGKRIPHGPTRGLHRAANLPTSKSGARRARCRTRSDTTQSQSSRRTLPMPKCNPRRPISQA